jgi:hypothetical protein
MRFKEFLTVNEAVAYVRNLNKQDMDLYGPQKFGWWDVYVAYPRAGGDFERRWANDKPGIFPFNDVRWHLTQTGILQKMTQAFNEAAQKLSGLGFPKSGGICVVRDFSKEVNQITGGGVGGHADHSNHAFAIDWSINPRYIVHEHAHMIWWHLPKPNRKLFQNWYYTNVDQAKLSPEVSYQHLTGNMESWEVEEKLENLIDQRAPWIVNDIIENTGISPDAINRVKSASPEDVAIHRLAFRPLHFIPARLKNNEYMSRISGPRMNVPANTKVKIAIVADQKRFLVDYMEGYGTYSIEPPVPASEISKHVYIDPELLTDEQRQQLDAKFPDDGYEYELYLDKKLEPTITKALQQGMDRIANELNLFGKSSSHYDKFFKAEQVFKMPQAAYKIFYNNMMVYDAGHMDGLTTAVKETLLALERSGKEIMGEMPQTVPQPRSMYSSIQGPEADPYRNLMAKRGIVPTPYSAANVDELWAETVENAAYGGTNVSPELKKLLVTVLSGPAGVVGQDWRKVDGKIVKDPKSPRKGRYEPIRHKMQ